MVRIRVLVLAAAFSLLAVGCGADSSFSVAPPSDSEVAVSVLSGVLNNTDGDMLGWNELRAARRSPFARILEELAPVHPAYAASWTCSSGSLAPPFAGPSRNPYAFTPVTCSVTFRNGRTTSSTWSAPFTLVYGPTCDATHAWIGSQAAGCSLARTTPEGGSTRTITGPLGGTYAITHDTNGAGTGWDGTVTPAPNNGGVVVTCGAAGCSGSAGAASILVNGSHVVGVVTLRDQPPATVWDHTLSTATPLTVTGSGTSRIVSGSLIVQRNLARETATAAFDGVGFGAAGCCFPTSGTVTTTFRSGSNAGRTETLTFTGVCGEATLVDAAGTTRSLTLMHCL